MLTRAHNRFFFVFSMLGMGLVLLTHLVRPSLVDPQPLIGFVFGVLPNFGAGFGVPSVLSIMVIRFLQIRNKPFQLRRVFWFASLVSLVGISIWEFTGGTIDANDLWATLAGTGCSCLTFLLCFSKKTSPVGEDHDPSSH